MTRNELIHLFVLDVLADDFESWDKTVADVTALGVRCGLTIGTSEIAGALTDLMRCELVRAYHVSPSHVLEPIRGILPSDDMVKSYFWITDNGQKLQSGECSGWPFDEKGLLRADWSPPVSEN